MTSENLQPADFGLVRMRGVVGPVIRSAQWLYNGVFKDYEHAFVYVGDDMIVEAMPGGALLSPLSKYDDEHVFWSSGLINWSEDETQQRAMIVAAVRGYVGTPYSFLDYLALAAHRLHVPAPGLRQYIASTRHLICSQLVDQGYLEGQQHLFTDNRWPGYVAPSSLYELLEAATVV